MPIFSIPNGKLLPFTAPCSTLGDTTLQFALLSLVSSGSGESKLSFNLAMESFPDFVCNGLIQTRSFDTSWPDSDFNSYTTFGRLSILDCWVISGTVLFVPCAVSAVWLSSIPSLVLLSAFTFPLMAPRRSCGDKPVSVNSSTIPWMIAFNWVKVWSAWFHCWRPKIELTLLKSTTAPSRSTWGRLWRCWW